MRMMNGEFVKYRIEKARESIKAAEVLINNNLWGSVINRLYYACYYAINALLAVNDIEVKTHAGLKSQFSLNFIKTEKIDKRFGELFSDLFDWRYQGDYSDFFQLDEKTIVSLVNPVKEFVDTVENLIDLK